MRRIRYSLALGLGALALSACTDQIDRSPTSPFAPQFSFTLLDSDDKLAFEGTIRTAISCLISDSKQELRKLSDFDDIVEKSNKGEVQTVTDWVNNFVRWADDYIGSKKTPPPDAADCNDRALTLAQAAQELYDLLYWYSGQYAKIVGGVYTDPNEDAGQVTCFPGVACELDGEFAFIRASDPQTFNFPVVLGFRPLEEADLPADFNQVGTPVPPYYEFFTIPEGVTANVGWGRYVCVSWTDYHTGDNQLYKLTNGELEVMPGQAQDIICPQPAPEITNSLLRHLHRFASRMTTPVRPRVLHATGHRAIGGPSTTASPHAVVRAASVSSTSCDDVTGWGDANAQSWDITSDPYPDFTSFASLTLYLQMDATPSTLTVSAQAQRFTTNETGGKDLGLASSVAYEVSGEEGEYYKVTFTWPAQPVQPGGRVDVNITGLNGTSVEYGVTDATGCVLQELGGSQRQVAGSIAGHPQGGNSID